MARDLRASVSRVLGKDGRTAGTAFFVLPKGYLVTCSHVLTIPAGSNEAVALRFSPDGRMTIELTATVCWHWSSPASEDDIAILELIDALPVSATPLAFGSGRPRLASTVDSWGYPIQNPEFGMPGLGEFMGMTRYVTTGADVYMVRGDTLARGFSGGPCVLRETGEVLGVVTALTTADAEGRWSSGCFLAPSEVVLRLCPNLTVGTPAAVEALVRPWTSSWEPFQKYIGTPDFAQAQNAPYRFPALEIASETSKELIDPLGLVRQQLASHEPRLAIVVGAPGTGKSRLLAELAWAACQSGPERAFEQPLVPILVTARSFMAARGFSVSEHLVEGLRSDAVFPGLKLVDVEAIDALLTEGRYRCLVLIDGADEIPSPAGRKGLFMRVAADAEVLLSEGHLVVMSTRPLYGTGNNALEKLSTLYRLTSLDPDEAERLVECTLGPLAEAFKEISKAAGLAASLDTPLLLNLAMALFHRRRERFPSTVLGIYEQFLELIQENWVDAPLPSQVILETLGSVALGSMSTRDSNCIEDWLGEIDHAVQDAHASALQRSTRTASALSEAQAALNFGMHSSGLMHRQADAIRWSHLLLRDYLAATQLSFATLADEASIQRSLDDQYSDSLRRESFVLFMVMESAHGRAERMLGRLRDHCGGIPLSLALFIKDCIYRGAVFGPDFVEQVFDAFEKLALADPRGFGGCASIFTSDYGPFWHLLTLQRIPQAQSAIARVVQGANPESMMCEWPHSERARLFSPRNLYAGPLASTTAIFPRDD